MSYTRLPYGRSSYGFAEFIVDTSDEIKTLPTACTPGSKAIVTDEGLEYILNNKHQWVIYQSSTGTGGEGMTQAQLNAAIESVLSNKNLVTATDLADLESRVTAQETANESQQTQIDNLEENGMPHFDSSQADSVLFINSNGEIEPRTVTAANGLITTTQTGQHTYEVAHNTGREEDCYLYECTSSDWSNFSIRDGESVKYTWNRLTYTAYVAADGNDFIIGDPNGTNPWVRFTHRQDLGVNKLIAKVYQPVGASIKDYTFRVTTGIPQDTDNLVLRANGVSYRLYIDTNGALKVAQIS